MSTPTLFLCADTDFENLVNNVPVSREYSIVHACEREEGWIEQLQKAQAGVAVIQSDRFTSDDYEKLLDS